MQVGNGTGQKEMVQGRRKWCRAKGNGAGQKEMPAMEI